MSGRTDPDPSPAKTVEDRLVELLDRARRGDREALPALREALDAYPEIWDRYGNLPSHVEQGWIDLIAGPDLVLAESLGRKVGALKDELVGPDPTLLERLLVGRIVVTWLMSCHADATLARPGEVSIRQADLAQKRQLRANKAHLTAIAALATIRRLLPGPTVEPGVAPGPKADRRVAPIRVIGTPVSEVGADGRAEAPVIEFPARSGTSILFDRPDPPPGRDVEPDRHRKERGRSSS